MFEERIRTLALEIEVHAVVYLLGDAFARERGLSLDHCITEMLTAEHDAENQLSTPELAGLSLPSPTDALPANYQYTLRQWLHRNGN